MDDRTGSKSRTLLTPQGDGNNRSKLNKPIIRILESRTLLTPQGDGNGPCRRLGRRSLEESRTLLTPQGDGNFLKYGSAEQVAKNLCPAPSLPRKGTETS